MNLLEVGLEKLRSVLGTDLERGLTSEQVLRNRKEFGENILFEKKNTVLDLLKKIFGDILMVLFLLAGVFDYLETKNRLSLIAVTTVIFLYASFVVATHVFVLRAQKRVELFSKSKYRVRRSGRIHSVAKSELVPGDILLLEKGDVMPCDGIILKQSALKILEASVTGRRVPVFKRTHEEVEAEQSGLPYFECILFAGSVVLHGSAKVFICNTGKNIFDNENFIISRQNGTVPKVYEIAMELKKQISLLWVIACFFLFAWGVFRGQNVFSIFHYVTAIVIAAFPDSMEHLCDLSIAHMTLKLFDSGVVLRNAGAVDRLCDVNEIFINSGSYLFYDHPVASYFYLGDTFFEYRGNRKKAVSLLENLLLAQDSKEFYQGKEDEWHGERAIMAAAASIGLQKRRLDRLYVHVNHYDYDPKYGFSCSLCMRDEKYRLIIRGEPNSVLSACSEIWKDGKSVPFNETTRTALRADARHLAGLCEKVVSVAVLSVSFPSTGDQRTLCRSMTYLGAFGLSTTVSAEAANAVSICRKSGISTHLLTDDYPETAAALAKSVSIISDGDFQYAMTYPQYEKMDRGIFIADLDHYKVYCGFEAEEKQSLVKYHKDNGNLTLSLTGNLYDTLPQLESDVSVVHAGEARNSVRLNADILVKEKRFELVPLCINWARIFYRSIVHIMQFVLLIQISLGMCVFISLSAEGQVPFHYFPMFLACFGSMLLSGVNILYRLPGPRLEDNRGVLREDRIASLQAILIVPILTGVTQAVAVMLSHRIALYASGGLETANGAALLTWIFATYVSSLSLKFDHPLFRRLKYLGKSELISFIGSMVLAYLTVFSPLKQLWQTGNSGSGFSPWIFIFSILLSFLPAVLLEWMKLLKKDDSAVSRDS